MDFPFEKMIVYQKAEKWAELAERIASRRGAHRFTYSILDQLSRSASSIPLNIAEGVGKWNSLDRQKYFQTARGSAFGCVPILNCLKRKKVITQNEHTEAYNLLNEISKMLTALIKVCVQKNIRSSTSG